MIGQTISHYKIIEKLGEGGMGVVYKAEDLTLGRTVALKFLPPGSVAAEEDRARLAHEARAAAALLHPNICPVYEIAESEGRMFIAMAHIEGRSLKDRIAEGPLPVDEALSIARQLGEALAAAHAKGVIHRDIKPANVMLLPDGRPILMDFGLAKVAGTTKLTRTGTTMGTVAYLSPEQVKGVGGDARSDIWALGVVLYEMISGRVPFGGEYEASFMYAILNEDPAPLAGKGKDTPAGIDGIIAKALEKDPARRYQIAEQFVDDIVELSRDSEALPAGRAKPAKSPGRIWRRWNWRKRAVAVGALAAIIAGFTWMGLKLWPGLERGIDSIGILPLVNLSGDPSKDFWAEMYTEQLGVYMGSIGSLQVKSHQSMRRFRGSTEPPRVIGRKVRAKALLGGSLALDGDRIRITVELTDAAKDRHIWGDTFIGSAEESMILLARISRGVATALKADLSAETEAHFAGARRADPRAYEAYLRGLQASLIYDLAGAEELYRSAVTTDSTLAAAWAALASLYAGQALGSYATPARVAPLARAALTKALVLDANLAETQAALGKVRLFLDWDWEGADAATKLAMELNPSNIAILKERRLFCYSANRGEESIQLQRRICELEPLNASVIEDMGWVYFYARRYDEAIAQLRKADEMSGKGGPNSMIAVSQYFRGRHREALAECDANPNPGMQEAFIYAKLGRREKALEFLRAERRRLEIGPPFNPLTLAVVSAGLGMKDEAFAWLHKSLEERWPEILQSPTEPYYEDLHADPRWRELVDLLHYPAAKP